jgi:hypothetical protein
MLMNLSDPVLAALIGASATTVGALIQLRLSWRREMRERAKGQPITKKSRRGPVLFVFALMIASAIGGFALSQYLLDWRNGDRDTLRAEVQAKLAEISASAAQLERTRIKEMEHTGKDLQQASSGFQKVEAVRLDAEPAAASVMVGPCRASASDSEGASRKDCTERSAVRVSVCAKVPAVATVKEVQLFTRLEDSQQPWPEARVQPGQDAGQARFQEKFFEQPDGDGAKQVCQGFAHWSAEKSRVARIVVRYAP